MRSTNKACSPANGIVLSFIDPFKSIDITKENSNEQLKTTRNVGIGKLTANIKKNSRSPRPKVSKSLFFITNRVYRNKISTMLLTTATLIITFNKKTSIN
jgi:hypothetical protein